MRKSLKVLTMKNIVLLLSLMALSACASVQKQSTSQLTETCSYSDGFEVVKELPIPKNDKITVKDYIILQDWAYKAAFINKRNAEIISSNKKCMSIILNANK